ncbi:asparaginase [Kwoniella heveanensis BCC8398]|uniref:asparaginase n=1 Tax=Kwoniella heveanensis BCC8398 TaxID=1296120 RepID=A0A1B9GY86_9TREE|nr:asparaginase [Kwoniella heveanensis BCC8398]
MSSTPLERLDSRASTAADTTASTSIFGSNNKKRRVICCVGTGGTIASEPTPGGLAPTRQDTFFRRIRSHPSLTSPDHFASDCVSFSSPVHTTITEGRNILYPRLITPELDDEGTQVEYDILDLDKHMDSSEMTPAEWNTVAALVHENWDKYDGFVILSGTDTLAYTAAILSFLFQRAGKPIMVTGAQIPLSRPRSDGWTNILDSLFVTGTMQYAGVGIVFHHQVLQGARATKTSPNFFGAFTSPCVPPLINFNVKITYDSRDSLPKRSRHPPPPLLKLLTDPTVLSVHIYPGMTGALLEAQIDSVPTCKAVIISAYGSGNLPINEESGVLQSLKRLVEREVLVVVISQCAIPNVYPLYTQGRTLLDIGVLPGYDLTHEAAFAKLIWLVSRSELTFRQRQDLFEEPLVGEMTV